MSVAGLGAHIRLHTAPGFNRIDRLFTVYNEVIRFGLRTVADAATTLRTLTIERVDPHLPDTDHFFSFDIECGLSVSTPTPLDDQVWGRTRDGEYGIRRLCAILDEHGITGNFMVDFGSCAVEGETRLREIVDFLLSSGHEVHAHLHENKVAELWGVSIERSRWLDGSDFDQIRRLLEYTARTYERCVGRPLRVFRSGSYRMSPQLVLAAGVLNIEALSNVRDNVGDPTMQGDRVPGREPFRWENGVVEIPVDVSSPEELSMDAFLQRRDNAVLRKRSHRTCTIVMHSWSLLRNKLPEPSTERIDMFHRICELASKEGRAWGFGEYLDHRATIEGKQRVTRLLSKRPRDDEPTPPPGTVTCNICDTVFKRESVVQDRCPSCSSSSRDRQARFVIDTYGLPLDWPVVGADPSNGSVPPSAVAVPGLDPVLGEASTVYLGVSGPEGGRRAGDHAWANPLRRWLAGPSARGGRRGGARQDHQ